MAHTHLFEIGYKPGITDPVGKGLKHDITQLGLGKVSHVASAQLYKITGKLSDADRTRITKDLLCDPILNEAVPSPRPLPGERKSEGKAVTIDVWYKPGVTDVAGESVLKGIRDLDITGVSEVRTGMRYHLQGVARKDAAEKIALALLVNPLVHDMSIDAN